MISVRDIATAAYGCIIGNWILNLFRTFSHHQGGEHRFVVVAQISSGEYIRVLETDTQSVALDFEGQLDEDTNSITGLTFDRLYPGDKAELAEMEILNSVPVDAEEREKLLSIIHSARKYW